MRPPNLAASTQRDLCGSRLAHTRLGKLPKIGHGRGPGGRRLFLLFISCCRIRWTIITPTMVSSTDSPASRVAIGGLSSYGPLRPPPIAMFILSLKLALVSAIISSNCSGITVTINGSGEDTAVN